MSASKWFNHVQSKQIPRLFQHKISEDFLLDPYQRRAFNEVHGFLTPTVNVAWWSEPETRLGRLEIGRNKLQEQQA